MSFSHQARHFALVPAGGAGTRVAEAVPKQYLPLCGVPLITHTLATLCASPLIERVYVVLSVGDSYWPKLDLSPYGDKLVPLFCGGASRAHSVLAGLRAMQDTLSPGDWVLVHDAARPCLAPWHITKLIDKLVHDEVGGLLAVPVADTLKRANAQSRVKETVDRAQLWQAQTPQMFRYIMLRRALETVVAEPGITDEASALEAAGLKPLLVEGDVTNLKVTYPLDLHMAEWILSSRRAT